MSSFAGSRRKLQGSTQCSSLSSTKGSRTYTETDTARKSRIDRQLRGLKVGDMICIHRDMFMHYAIYIGNGKVVDFNNDNAGDVSVRTIYEVVGDSDCNIDNNLDGEYKPYSPDDIVKRALEQVPKTLTYDLGRFNCEHFATWIRYGVERCHQPCEVAATLGKVINKNQNYQ